MARLRFLSPARVFFWRSEPREEHTRATSGRQPLAAYCIEADDLDRVEPLVAVLVVGGDKVVRFWVHRRRRSRVRAGHAGVLEHVVEHRRARDLERASGLVALDVEAEQLRRLAKVRNAEALSQLPMRATRIEWHGENGCGTLHRAPVGQGPPGPGWLAISFGFWSGRALATGTAWAGLCLIHHNRGEIAVG